MLPCTTPSGIQWPHEVAAAPASSPGPQQSTGQSRFPIFPPALGRLFSLYLLIIRNAHWSSLSYVCLSGPISLALFLSRRCFTRPLFALLLPPPPIPPLLLPFFLLPHLRRSLYRRPPCSLLPFIRGLAASFSGHLGGGREEEAEVGREEGTKRGGHGGKRGGGEAVRGRDMFSAHALLFPLSLLNPPLL